MAHEIYNSFDPRMPGLMSDYEPTPYEEAVSRAAAAIFSYPEHSDPVAYAATVTDAMHKMVSEGVTSNDKLDKGRTQDEIVAQAVVIGWVATAFMRHHGENVAAGIIASESDQLQYRLHRPE